MRYEDGYESIEISDEDITVAQRIIVEGFMRDGEFKARRKLISFLQEDIIKHISEPGVEINQDWVDGVNYAIHVIKEVKFDYEGQQETL